MDMRKGTYPFCGVVGQKELKLALILALINPCISGVLIKGEKGTAKSTLVRSLPWILPSLKVVTIPLSTDIEALRGYLDWEEALRKGEMRWVQGLLTGKGERVIYVDEVNLLEEHLMDYLFWKLSSSHGHRPILIGTMNPEEGEVGPHFLDRFGLCIQVRGEKDKEKRIKILERRQAHDKDPYSFARLFERSHSLLHHRILMARERLSSVSLSRDIKGLITNICVENRVEGHRADIVMAETARAYAAFRGSHEVSQSHVIRIAPLVLLHRKRGPSKKNTPISTPPVKKGPPSPPRGRGEDSSAPLTKGREDLPGGGERGRGDEEGGGNTKGLPLPEDQVFEVGDLFRVKRISSPRDKRMRKGSGRRSRTYTCLIQGRYVRARPTGVFRDIALDATIRAAIPYQVFREKRSEMAITIFPSDLHRKIREKKSGNLLVFVVDASGSMGARSRMVATKGAILSLLLDAYQKRDRVAMISFRGRGARLNLPPTRSVEMAARMLSSLPVGGRTPLVKGLISARELVRSQRIKDPSLRPIVIVITDGKNNVSVYGADPWEEMKKVSSLMREEGEVKYLVIDTEEEAVVQLQMGKVLAQYLGASYFRLEELRADNLLEAIKERL